MTFTDRLAAVANGAAVARRTLAEQIVDHVRDQIGQGILEPGQKLTIQAMARELDVSMTPVREAFKTLAALRLVEFEANRGATVSRIDRREAAEMLLVYSRLDMLGGELAALNATASDVDALRSLLARQAEAVHAGDRIAYFHVNQAFHRRLAAASANPTLIDMHTNLSDRLWGTRFRGMDATAENWHSLAEEHMAIVDAVEARDARRVADLLRHHFRGAWTALGLPPPAGV